MSFIEYDAMVQVFLLIGMGIVVYKIIELDKKFNRMLRLLRA